MENLYFWVFAVVTIAASLGVVLRRNPMHSVLLLIVSFGALSGLYILLNAPFVAAIQIIIYAGAIMVLFLFVVMLLNAGTEDPPGVLHNFKTKFGGPGPRWFGAVLAVVLFAELFWAMSKFRSAPFPGASDATSSVYQIGLKLFREYSFAFEATSVLILVAMVGAVILARKES
jgi:NADH-quinone oxidoreductase subunit J